MAEICRMEFEITGKRIQKAGFRAVLEEIALELEITGSAKNEEKLDETGLKRHSVRVVAEGTREGLERFMERINATNTFHKINPINTAILRSAKPVAKRSCPEFSIVRSPDEIPERMDEAVFYVKDMYKQMHGLNDGMRSMKEETNGNFRTMEEKYHAISNNLDFFVDVAAEYAATTKPQIKDKIAELRRQYGKA
ncbi:MAG: acylphosphatase [Candidatus Micrarchaeota archaeon]